MAVVWAYHYVVLRADTRQARTFPRQAGIRRLYLYLVAAIGLASFLGGLIAGGNALIRTLLDRGHAYRTEDARVIFVTSGTVAGTARGVIDTLREGGMPVGLARIRLFRPFPAEELRRVLAPAQKVVVFDRNISFGLGGTPGDRTGVAAMGRAVRGYPHIYSTADAVLQGNDTLYGLAAGVWTRDVQKAHRVARAIRAGTVWVNCYNVFDPVSPFGGYKQSGYGREKGIEALHHYTQVKCVTIKL